MDITLAIILFTFAITTILTFVTLITTFGIGFREGYYAKKEEEKDTKTETCKCAQCRYKGCEHCSIHF